jgi:hypothetical protein
MYECIFRIAIQTCKTSHKQKLRVKAEGMAQAVMHMGSKCEVLNSNSSISKKANKQNK